MVHCTFHTQMFLQEYLYTVMQNCIHVTQFFLFFCIFLLILLSNFDGWYVKQIEQDPIFTYFLHPEKETITLDHTYNNIRNGYESIIMRLI